ncbi:hypothetical protein CIG75_00115 [Tumebacillus algifaecis]|uniref:Uncharacterized protein n=1 Tax=Tumebacillus algifaecis TaxID=1214604 RepID=A0A223CWF4_9BACL|nr:hypothetical protein [Tumebacillus algifaecis]ASS73535.1 hypothetical protein CIG75_00115 [Tumebacillus algifaecis]
MSTLFVINIIVFIICIVLQYKAFHRMAFNRGLFIQIAMFFFTGLVYMAPNAPRLLVWIVFILTWAFTLLITSSSIRHIRQGK